MGNKHRTILDVLLAVVSTPLLIAQAPQKEALPHDVREAFEWYDTLGYPKTASLKWIGVLPGEEVQWGDDPAVRVPTRAFLLSDDETRFTVLLPDLRQRIFKRETISLSIRVPAGEMEKKRAEARTLVFPQAKVRWQKQSFEKDARALLALGRQVVALANPPIRRDPFADPDRFAAPDPFVQSNPPAAPDPSTTVLKGLEELLGWSYNDHRRPLRAILFIIGHACYERKLTTLAGELCATATLLPAANSDDGGGPDLRSKMQCDLGYLAMFRAVEAVGGTEFGLPWDPSTTRPLQSRKQLLKRFRDFAGQYPASRYVPYSKEVAAMLESMIAEDEAHVSPTDKEMEHMFVEQQAQELIFRLRDQNGHQWIAPGNCDVFDDYYRSHHPEAKRDSPADRLVAIGGPAVQALMAATNDKRLTRTVCCWRRYTYSHSILTVGEVAQAIMQRIAAGGKSPYELDAASK